MPSSDVTIRRATLDDLEMLRGLWRECRQPEYELEKRFTEFQVAVDRHGWILAALGLRVAGHHGEVHHLAVRQTDDPAAVAGALWERAHTLANQQNIHRLWARDSRGFGEEQGFVEAKAGERKELPRAFGQAQEHWLTLKLREDPLRLIAAEEQLEAYLEFERLKTERLIRRGRMLKVVATTVAAVIFAFALAGLVLVLRRRRPDSQRR